MAPRSPPSARLQEAAPPVSTPQMAYLQSYLAPLAPYLAQPDITDIYINRPAELWTERLGGQIERHVIPALDETHLLGLARQVAAFAHQGVSRAHPLLSAALPDGTRVQVVLPPAARQYPVLAFRRHVAAGIGLDDFCAGAIVTSPTSHAGFNGAPGIASASGRLRTIAPAEWTSVLREAVRARRTILISGGTASGKTTFLGSLIAEIPANERLVIIEDTPELNLGHDNAVGLLAARGQLGEAIVSADDLVTAALRLRPDRILLGELRGPEALAFLRAVNSGHPGSMTTVHADSPDGAVEQIALLIMQAGTMLTRADIHSYVRSVVGVYVQLGRSAGKRGITEMVVAD